MSSSVGSQDANKLLLQIGAVHPDVSDDIMREEHARMERQACIEENCEGTCGKAVGHTGTGRFLAVSENAAGNRNSQVEELTSTSVAGVNGSLEGRCSDP